MEIEIPFKTPTINHLYGQHGVHKYLKPEARALRDEIEKIVFDCAQVPPLNKKLSVTVQIHENWLTKKGDVKKKDVSNREKFLIDSIFDAIGVDDKMIYKHTMEKIQSNEEKAVIKIEEYNG